MIGRGSQEKKKVQYKGRSRNEKFRQGVCKAVDWGFGPTWEFSLPWEIKCEW